MPVYKKINVISKVALQNEILKKFLYATTMSKGWTTKKVVPDVIDAIPKSKLIVEYPEVTVNEGNLVKPAQAKAQPVLAWKVEKGSLYTVCMVDPDAPSRENHEMRSWKHWLVINIPDNDVDKGEHVAEYIGAGPPKGTGLHRYVLLLYKQPSKYKTSKKIDKNTAKGRPNFSITNFAKKYNLGIPIAGNFFEAEYDDYVPVIFKQLGF